MDDIDIFKDCWYIDFSEDYGLPDGWLADLELLELQEKIKKAIAVKKQKIAKK